MDDSGTIPYVGNAAIHQCYQTLCFVAECRQPEGNAIPGGERDFVYGCCSVINTCTLLVLYCISLDIYCNDELCSTLRADTLCDIVLTLLYGSAWEVTGV